MEKAVSPQMACPPTTAVHCRRRCQLRLNLRRPSGHNPNPHPHPPRRPHASLRRLHLLRTPRSGLAPAPLGQHLPLHMALHHHATCPPGHLHIPRRAHLLLLRLLPDRPYELISAVDIYHRGKLILSKVIETETVTGWFRYSPFRIDLLDPKDVVPTHIKYPEGQEADTCRELGDDLTLSWILIDPTGRRALNLSSHAPVSVQRHWLSGELHAQFASILAGEKGTASEDVQCGIFVTCGGSEGGEMQVREVSLQVEDMDGMHLNGREGLVILDRALEGRKGRKGRRRVGEGKKRYEEYLQRTKERKERKLRTEGTLDTLCVAFGVFGFFIFWSFILCR
ncbi:F-box protein [Pyrus ussuriensis x Pyrus communis]|uniref:F-box protein n=1 Tax=Pyrus ussuriensis x Pyrus communis TaxID=2448454 RepID=A0A5N5HZZ3_9ROSA|nr:F-box protein [Pyrus ussuriensis x Pyrus communis]